jgi:hypothetical protein
MVVVVPSVAPTVMLVVAVLVELGVVVVCVSVVLMAPPLVQKDSVAYSWLRPALKVMPSHLVCNQGMR